MPIDVRSDTVTQPTPGMKKAMLEAPLGDDVLDGDPTTKKLQILAAKMFGKEDALFFPTGTMANLCAMMAWTNRGEGILTGDLNHVVFYEQGGMSQIGGVPNFQLPILSDSTFDLDLFEKKLKTFAPIDPGRDIDQHHVKISCVALETPSTQNKGICYPMDFPIKVRELCDKHKIGIHLDGARCFNAIHKHGLFFEENFSGISKFSEPYDSISLCLSKSVGAPVGSLLIGTKNFIAKARRIRKALGGTMRQSGILAAAGIYGLEHNAPRMGQDNKNAKKICDFAVNELGLEAECETNGVFIMVEDNFKMVSDLKDKGILATAAPPNMVRMMCHLHIGDGEVIVEQNRGTTGTAKGTNR